MVKKNTLFLYLSVFISTSYAKDYGNYSICVLAGQSMTRSHSKEKTNLFRNMEHGVKGIKATVGIDKNFSISTGFYRGQYRTFVDRGHWSDAVDFYKNQVHLTGNVHPLKNSFYFSLGLTYTKGEYIPCLRKNTSHYRIKTFGQVFLLGYNSSVTRENTTFLDFSAGFERCNLLSWDNIKLIAYQPIILLGLGVTM